MISVSGARAAYVGPRLDLAPHRNAVATIAIAIDTPFELEVLEEGGESCTSMAALIPPGALHHLRASGDMAFIYLDPMSDDFSALAEIDFQQARARVVQAFLDARSTLDADTLCAAFGVPPRPVKDRRIADVVRQVDAHPQDFSRVDHAAGLAGLSASRFQALWRDAIGLSFRRYRLWRRMAVVVAAMSSGRSLTEAAYDAGFSSSAHLSTTFRAMFGLAPSSLAALGVALRVRDAESNQKVV